MLRVRRAPATEGKEAAQGATRRDWNPDSAPRRGGDGFSSATAPFSARDPSEDIAEDLDSPDLDFSSLATSSAEAA